MQNLLLFRFFSDDLDPLYHFENLPHLALYLKNNKKKPYPHRSYLQNKLKTVETLEAEFLECGTGLGMRLNQTRNITEFSSHCLHDLNYSATPRPSSFPLHFLDTNPQSGPTVMRLAFARFEDQNYQTQQQTLTDTLKRKSISLPPET